MTGGLKFQIDTESPIAVYMQIENQILFAIASGRIKENEAVPPVREVAANLGVNSNTVTKAYRDLEIRGLLRARRGVGVRVSENARKLCREAARKLAGAHLKDAVAECTAAGMKTTEIRKAVSNTIKSGRTPYARREK